MPLARQVAPRMVDVIGKRRNAAKGMAGRALREPAENATAVLRPLPICPILPAERALQCPFLQALKSHKLTGQDTI